MQTAIERRNPTERPAGLQDAAIERDINISQSRTCNNSKCLCVVPCKICKCKKPRLNPLAVIAISRYRDELTLPEITRELSELVDCCNVILMANQEGKL